MVHPPLPERTDLFKLAAALSTISAHLVRGVTLLDRDIPAVAVTLDIRVTDAAGHDLAKLHLADALARKLGCIPVVTEDPHQTISQYTEGPVLCRVVAVTGLNTNPREAELQAEVDRLRAELARTRVH